MQEPIPHEYYGDASRWFVATVVDSSPPAGLEGRVRIRVYGIHTPYTGDITQADLPWAQVLIPGTEGGISGIGRNAQVSSGAFVFGVFLDGKDSQLPIVIGSLPRNEFASAVQSKSPTEDYSFDYNQVRQINYVTETISDDLQQYSNVSRRRSQAMKFFINNGYTPIQAAGIVGNLEQTSRFRIYESDQSIDYTGIASWRSTQNSRSRFDALIEFAGLYEPKTDWRSFSLQLQFVLYEMRTSFNLVNSKLNQAEVLEGKDGTVEIFAKYYLRKLNTGAINLAKLALEEAYV